MPEAGFPRYVSVIPQDPDHTGYNGQAGIQLTDVISPPNVDTEIPPDGLWQPSF